MKIEYFFYKDRHNMNKMLLIEILPLEFLEYLPNSTSTMPIEENSY
jgi:hypothetical protein